MASATVGIDYMAKNQINDLVRLTNQLQNSVNSINSSVGQVTSSIAELRAEFEAFRKDQAKDSAINRATTELVRVRQELQQKFSNYSVVRENMLGVLQATDLALVKKDTIARVSEELMLSTPEYWLAPCLVAVAAWIGNDKDLAERAIREAVRRDEAKTALTMALICRRNERQQTCYEWLAVYFSHQDASNFSESTLMYIDAYVNGIFGNDEKHICDDYINKWMAEVRANSSNIEASQEQVWKEYCSGFSYEISEQFPDLKSNVVEFERIDGYVRRINSVAPITKSFNDITHMEVNKDTLKANIDKRLIQLIGRYDDKESGLKDEEHYYDLVKRLGGDEQKAMAIIAREKQESKERTLNLVEQMTNVIVSPQDNTPSMKKTAVSFLRGFINKGFNSYISEKQSEFPNQITIDIGGWKAQTQSGDDVGRLVSDYENNLAQRRQRDIQTASSIIPKALLIGGGALALVGLIMLIALPVMTKVFGGLLLAGGIGLALYGLIRKKNVANKIIQINQQYDMMAMDGRAKISRVCEQWKKARGVVTEFESRSKESIIA